MTSSAIKVSGLNFLVALLIWGLLLPAGLAGAAGGVKRSTDETGTIHIGNPAPAGQEKTGSPGASAPTAAPAPSFSAPGSPSAVVGPGGRDMSSPLPPRTRRPPRNVQSPLLNPPPAGAPAPGAPAARPEPPAQAAPPPPAAPHPEE